MSEDLKTRLNQPIQIFFSYSHEDEKLLDDLIKHLSNLKKQGGISLWHDRLIPPGEKWPEEIDDRINKAQIILLLISPAFFASEYCRQVEMRRALERHNDGEAVVIPIILRLCDWEEEPFDKLQALPKALKPVTLWANQDEAFRDIAKDICTAVKNLRDKSATSATPPKTRRLNIEQFGEHLRREEAEQIHVVHPYLLGDEFVGREKELGDLTNWLVKDEDKILCIYNLGGTGKSALVWHWLHSQTTRDTLKELEASRFWCTFYARNYDANKFLRELATKLGGATVVVGNAETAQRELQRVILERLKKEKWLLVLDGLEREMGAFANPEHYLKDSEEQDCRNEKGDVWLEERGIRDYVFADFLRNLLMTQTKVLITSRLFSENLTGLGGQPLPGVIRYPLVPMSPEDAERVWNRFCKPEGSAFQRDFFESVKFHPQVISVVAAAMNWTSSRLKDWFSEFSEPEQQACLDTNAPLTARRHRWLDLATRDVIRDRRDAWLTLCYIVRRSEAGSVDTLMDSLVDRDTANESRPGRFQTEEKLRDELDYLVKRRLIGVGYSNGEEMVDVHPVIRGQVWDYIQAQCARGGEAGQELARHLELKNSRELRLRLLDLPDLDEGLQPLKEFAKSEDSHNLLDVLRTFYPKPQPGQRRNWPAAMRRSLHSTRPSKSRSANGSRQAYMTCWTI